VKLGANAPAGCKATLQEEPEDDSTQQLNNAFSSALGDGSQQQPGSGAGPMADGGTVSLGGGGQSVAVQCAKS